MNMKNPRQLLNLAVPLLVLASCASFASAVENKGAEYRRRRGTNAAVDKLGALLSTGNERNPGRTTVAMEKDQPRKLVRRSRRARGSHTNTNANTRQSRRELGKSSGKSSYGKSNSGKSNSGGTGGSGSSGSSSSGGAGGSGSSGSSSNSGVGWSSSDGSYCGCLCMSNYATSGISNFGVSCDFTVDQTSYGYGKRSTNGQQQDKFGEFQSYFQWSQWTSWSEVEGKTDDHFTDYGYANQDWQAYEGRNEMDDAYVYEENEQNNQDNENGQENDNDDAAQEQDDDDAAVVVDQMNSGYDPYMAFDVGNCDTYAHLWTYDLLVSCANGDQYCECTFTEELMRMGLLSCSDAASCPDECGVCSNCINSVCGQYIPSKLIATEIENNKAITTVVILGTICLLLTILIAAHRRRIQSSKLKASLVDKHWMVPVNEENGLPTDKGKNCTSVWLAPDVSTIPRKPLFPDLLKGTIETKKKNEMKAKIKEEIPSSSQSHKTPTKETTSADTGVVELSPVSSEGSDSPRLHHPGPWLIPSSNASVPSSISDSTESRRSVGTMEGEI